MATHRSESARKPMLYYGAVIQSRSLTEIDAWPQALLAVSGDGIIAWLEPDVHSSALEQVVSSHGWELISTEFVEAAKGDWLMPGLIDTHAHASQFPNLGTGQQFELLDWLTNITFPTEARFLDVKYAQTAYNSVVTRTLNNGTTTCCYYATLHSESSKILADITFTKGQRAFIGKCNMNRYCPPDYIEASPESSLADTADVIEHIRGLDSKSFFPLVQAILTPRFAISCTHELLQGIGELFHKDFPNSPHPPLLLQTHISENPTEVITTVDLFSHLPSPKELTNIPSTHDADTHTYASIYDYFGLLDKRTILAHGVHLTGAELDLIKTRNVGLSHCAGSNFNLRSGVASVGEWLERGIKVGLGTDVSGGTSPSIISEIRHASIASKTRAMMDNKRSSSDPSPSPFTSAQGLSVATLLYLATLGGASLCNLEDRIGSFAAGKEFDALSVSLAKGGNPAVWYEADRDESLDVMLERFLFCGDDRNVRKVWVRGRLVGGADFGHSN